MVRPVSEKPGARGHTRIRVSIVIAVALSSLVSVFSAPAQQDARAVRSAYVYNLTKYVAWPESKRAILIGFFGDHETGNSMKQVLDGRSSDGRMLHVLLNPTDSDLAACDILYVTGAETLKRSPSLARLEKMPILTIGEDRRFAERGGMVGLIRSGDQIQIEVNLGALQHGGLRMSSRLLELATIVSSKETLN